MFPDTSSTLQVTQTGTPRKTGGKAHLGPAKYLVSRALLRLRSLSSPAPTRSEVGSPPSTRCPQLVPADALPRPAGLRLSGVPLEASEQRVSSCAIRCLKGPGTSAVWGGVGGGEVGTLAGGLADHLL